jgi:hypothetical protein
MVSRRDFLKQAGAFTAGFLLMPEDMLGQKNPEPLQVLEQKIVINLPAYELILQDYEDGILREEHLFNVNIGRGAFGRKPTPIGDGFVFEKRKQVIFTYGQDYPAYNKKAGDIIYWTNTFDDNGKPIGYKMPYDLLRGLGMKIWIPGWNDYDYSNVIHSTTDEFTVGVPASHGCTSIAMKDMLRLFDLVAPQVKDGAISKPIPLKTIYEIVELKGEDAVLHANVYNRPRNHYDELYAKTLRTDIFLDEGRVKKEFESADNDFKNAHKEILSTLLKSWPNNYLAPELKERLHRSYSLSDLTKPEI